MKVLLVARVIENRGKRSMDPEHILSDSTGSCLGTFLEHADITPALMASFASVLSQIVSKGLAIGDCSWLVTRLHIPDIVNISPQRSRFKF